MIRCYLPPARWSDSAPELDEDESKHLVGVMRALPGATVEVLDGAGSIATAEILSAHKKHTRLRILSKNVLPPPAPRRILMQALVREQRMDWLIQKAVELGVHEIRPLQTDRSVVRIAPGEAARKSARWQSIALAACKQSGNPWMPRIAPVRPLADELNAWTGAAACFGALQPGARPLHALFARWKAEHQPEIALFIGPEGDFSPPEVAHLLSVGVRPVTFGPIVFRVETAALYVLSAVQYAWQESPPNQQKDPP